MIQKVRVKVALGPDLRGEAVLHDIKHLLNISNIDRVEAIKVYRLEGVSVNEAETLAQRLLCEDINQRYTVNKSLVNGRTPTLEIAYKAGVMNPEVASVIKSANDLNIYPKAVDSSYEYLFYGKVKKDEVLKIASKVNLFNQTVEHIVEKEPKTLVIEGKVGSTVVIPIRDMIDEQLLDFSKDKLFLNLEEMKIIQSYFKKINRDPTDCELETLAQTWSEHSGHKTFRAKLNVNGEIKEPLILRIKKEALKHKKNIISAFDDNSGVMEFYNGFGICGKVETHNAPSAIEPYGGAMTGSGGVFRDILGTGKGAKAIASTDIFCFAAPNLPLSKLPIGCLPPEYLLKRVVSGVRDYGNRMGIPTNNGSVHFHEDFRARPTVIVGAYGIIPKKLAKKGKPKKGDLIISLGGRIGRDGIHGATFASGEMTDRTINVNSSSVQIGNAIEEKRMFDAILEARDMDLIRALQDCGGGGLSSAIGELGERLGVSVDLKNAHIKYPGLAPWEMWVSESQERMVLVIAKTNLNKLLKICDKYNVESSILGTFDGSKKLKIYYDKNLVCNLDMDFLHHGLPKRLLSAKAPRLVTKNRREPKLPKSERDWLKVLTEVLAHGNVCSKEPIVRLYDHSVQGTNDLQPYGGVNQDGPNDAVVLRPILDKPYGMVIAHGLNPILNRMDPYWGSMWAAVEALSNYVAVGGDYKNASLINNYVWPFPDEESLWSLDRSVDAVVDLMRETKIPVISGKDSLSSTYRGKNNLVIKIPEVLCISVFGRIPNASKTITADLKKLNSVICLLGKPDFESMGGSTYFDTQELAGNKVPKVDLKQSLKIFDVLFKAIQQGEILSCHDISEGGLITTVFEMCVGGDLGVDLDITKLGKVRSDYLFLNETAGCFIVEVENENVAKRIFKKIPFTILGKTVGKKVISAKSSSKSLFFLPLELLKISWQQPMRRIFT